MIDIPIIPLRHSANEGIQGTIKEQKNYNCRSQVTLVLELYITTKQITSTRLYAGIHQIFQPQIEKKGN